MDIISLSSFLGLCFFIFLAAFFQFSAFLWAFMIGIVLFVISFFHLLSFLSLIILWLLYIGILLFVYLHALRQRYVIDPLYLLLKKQMPMISHTERIAIETGDTWWEKELIRGRPRWKKLFAVPKPILSKEEQSFLDNQVETLCSMLNDWEITFEYHDLPEAVWAFLKKEKFFGMILPKQYGGLGFSALAHSTVITKLATRSVNAAVTTMVPNSLGPGELLLRYGTEEQKNHYLPLLASGEAIPCFALTGPDAGSDASAIPDTGTVCRGIYDGQEILGICLNWDKRYITLAPVATVIGLAFRLYDPEGLLGDKKEIGITLCLIPATHPGVEIGNRHFPMHLAFMNGPTRGKDVFIPLDWIIGGIEKAGLGWRMLMECLSIGRSISLPALSTGSGKIAYRLTGAYTRVRRQFNSALSSFEGIEEALGYIAGYTYMLEACRIMTAGAIDQKMNPAIVSAIAKYQMTEMCRQVISHAMDVHAGHMIQVGPRNFLAAIYDAIPISVTVEGANILTRNLIIFSQGVIRCHPYLLKEIELITAKEKNISAIDRVLMSHLGYFINHLLRNIIYGLTGGRFIVATLKDKRIKKYQRQLTRMSAALALLTEMSLMVLGGKLKRRERLSARLADIMSQLYLASTVLKYYYDQQQPASDKEYVCWSLQQSLSRIYVACNELFYNFPIPWIGTCLRWIIFPFGQQYFSPKDKLHHAVVSDMIYPSTLRDRLTQYCYISTNQHDLSYRLEAALLQLPIVEPLYKKLKTIHLNTAEEKTFTSLVKIAVEMGVLTPAEEILLNDFEKLREEIIKVNEFSFDLQKIMA